MCTPDDENLPVKLVYNNISSFSGNPRLSLHFCPAILGCGSCRHAHHFTLQWHHRCTTSISSGTVLAVSQLYRKVVASCPFKCCRDCVCAIAYVLYDCILLRLIATSVIIIGHDSSKTGACLQPVTPNVAICLHQGVSLKIEVQQPPLYFCT